jgi:hypothetical protein
MSTFLCSSVKFLLAPDKLWSIGTEYTLEIVVWSVIIRRWDYCDKEEYQRKRYQVDWQYCQLRPIRSLMRHLVCNCTSYAATVQPTL